MKVRIWNVSDKLSIKSLRFYSFTIASRPFRLRSKCSICSRRFESRRWSHWGQALSSGFLDFGRDHPSSLGPVPRIQRWAKYSRYSYSSTILVVLVLVLVLEGLILVLVLVLEGLVLVLVLVLEGLVLVLEGLVLVLVFDYDLFNFSTS